MPIGTASRVTVIIENHKSIKATKMLSYHLSLKQNSTSWQGIKYSGNLWKPSNCFRWRLRSLFCFPVGFNSLSAIFQSHTCKIIIVKQYSITCFRCSDHLDQHKNKVYWCRPSFTGPKSTLCKSDLPLTL